MQGSEAGAGAGAGASIYLSFGLIGAGADTFILNLGSDSGVNVIYGHMMPCRCRCKFSRTIRGAGADFNPAVK